MKDVMIDFETFGNSAYKCVCQVAAIYFDSITGELGDFVKFNIDASSHQKYGGKLDAETIYWWLEQSDGARQGLSENKIDIRDAMTQLNLFLHKAERVWSHATFDFVTLMDTFKQLNIKPLINYKQGLDLRTLVFLARTTTYQFPRDGLHHDALDDCKYQVKYCVKALNSIKIIDANLS